MGSLLLEQPALGCALYERDTFDKRSDSWAIVCARLASEFAVQGESLVFRIMPRSACSVGESALLGGNPTAPDSIQRSRSPQHRGGEDRAAGERIVRESFSPIVHLENA